MGLYVCNNIYCLFLCVICTFTVSVSRKASARAFVCYISAFYQMSCKLLCGEREGLNCVLSAFSLECNIVRNSSYTSACFCQVLYHWCICVCVCVWLHYYFRQVLYQWCVFGNTNSYFCLVLYHWWVCLITLILISVSYYITGVFVYTNCYFFKVLYYWCVFGYTNSYYCEVLYHRCVCVCVCVCVWLH